MGSDHPLTHRHLHLSTVVGIAALLAVILPIGVEAATGNAVNITDPTNARRKASVTGAGRLLTSTCDGDSCAAVDSGKLRIGDGSGILDVQARPGIPTKSRNALLTISQFGSDSVVFPFGSTFTADQRFALTSLTLSNTGTAALETVIGVKDGCTSGVGYSNVVTWVSLPVGESVAQSFPAPIVLSSTTTWCLRAAIYPSVPAGSEVQVTASGFIV